MKQRVGEGRSIGHHGAHDAASWRRPRRCASTGATLADAQPWHYWIAFVLLLSVLGIVLIALPVGYYLRVCRLKHPRR